VLANLHIIWLLDKDKEILPLNQKFSQYVPVQGSVMLYQNDMSCKDTDPGIGITLIPF
jgi:hypothetical protein